MPLAFVKASVSPVLSPPLIHTRAEASCVSSASLSTMALPGCIATRSVAATATPDRPVRLAALFTAVTVAPLLAAALVSAPLPALLPLASVTVQLRLRLAAVAVGSSPAVWNCTRCSSCWYCSTLAAPVRLSVPVAAT